MKRFYIYDDGVVRRFWAKNKQQAKCLCLIMFDRKVLVSELKPL